MGYDIDMFLNPIHPELICSICKNVLEDPIFLPLCTHVFCSPCISRLIDSSGREIKCPIDETSIELAKEKLLKNKVSLPLKNIILGSIVYCKYKDNGCQGTFSLSAYLEHINKCEFKEIPETGQNNSRPVANHISNQMILKNSADKSMNQSSDLSLNRSKSDSLCGMSHPKKKVHVYFNMNFKLKENCKIVKLEFKNIISSYKPLALASCIKKFTGVDVHCVHGNLNGDSARDLHAFVSDDDCDNVMRDELWLRKITIEKRLGFKRFIMTGSLKKTKSKKTRKNMDKMEESNDLSNATHQKSDSKEKDSDQTDIPQPDD